MKAIQRKVCLLGDFAVGKTSLVRRFVEGRFDDRYLSTIGVKISRKTMLQPEVAINLLVWDIAGGDEYNNAEASYLRGAKGALIVCDLTRKETLSGLRRYTDQLRELDQETAVVFLGNKKDLTEQMVITEQEIQELAEEFGCQYHLTSAKTGEGVLAAFETLAAQLV